MRAIKHKLRGCGGGIMRQKSPRESRSRHRRIWTEVRWPPREGNRKEATLAIASFSGRGVWCCARLRQRPKCLTNATLATSTKRRVHVMKCELPHARSVQTVMKRGRDYDPRRTGPRRQALWPQAMIIEQQAAILNCRQGCASSSAEDRRHNVTVSFRDPSAAAHCQQFPRAII